MVDFTTIELNTIPLPVMELQEINADLVNKNNVLLFTVGVCGSAIMLFLIAKIIHHYKTDNND
jgi:hypothetical protein